MGHVARCKSMPWAEASAPATEEGSGSRESVGSLPLEGIEPFGDGRQLAVAPPPWAGSPHGRRDEFSS